MGKSAPEYKGVDPKLAPYVDEYLTLARMHGITFNNTVTVGFKNINQGSVVGICNWGLGWHEIDVDSWYWNRLNEIQKNLIILHEADHCYCSRKHDYYLFNGRHNNYIADYRKAIDDPNNKDGFYKDGCPLSIMFPEVLETNCYMVHYGEYINELFRGCDPY
jgi:hypothetical protein